MATKSVIAPEVIDKKGYYRLDITMVPSGGKKRFKYSIAVPGWRANSEIEFSNKSTLWDYTESIKLVELTKEQYSDMIRYEPLDDEEVTKEKKPRKPRIVKEK
jgi:hypothetical protein